MYYKLKWVDTSCRLLMPLQLWQPRCHCNPDQNKFSPLSKTIVVVHLCLWRRSLFLKLRRIGSVNLYRTTTLRKRRFWGTHPNRKWELISVLICLNATKFGLLQCERDNHEHLKYVRNVYCVMINHSKDQDTRTGHKTTNAFGLVFSRLIGFRRAIQLAAAALGKLTGLNNPVKILYRT